MIHSRPGAVIMIGAERASVPEKLLDRALRAAALDLAARLRAAGIGQIILAGPDLTGVPDGAGVHLDPDTEPFHFGGRLAGLIERHALSPAFYFGAGSAPLLSTISLTEALTALEEAERAGIRLAVTNNLYSCDWLGLSQAREAAAVITRATRDNGLAWSLQEHAAYRVQTALAPDSAAQIDLDTPADLALVRAHPACPPGLRRTLQDPLLDRVPVGALLDVLAQDGSRVALFGRVAPAGWQALSRATRCWIRAFSEERGMAASERLARGEVRSLIAVLLREIGPARFLDELATMADGAIFDTRVLMAASGRVPGAADRFASDLLRPDWIADPWLRDFTAAAQQAPIPLLLGGHGAVSGGLFALAEIVAERRARRQEYQ